MRRKASKTMPWNSTRLVSKWLLLASSKHFQINKVLPVISIWGANTKERRRWSRQFTILSNVFCSINLILERVFILLHSWPIKVISKRLKSTSDTVWNWTDLQFQPTLVWGRFCISLISTKKHWDITNSSLIMIISISRLIVKLVSFILNSKI